MKYFTYLAISVMVIAVTSLFFLKKPDGQTWLSTTSVSTQTDSLKEKAVALSSYTFSQVIQNIKNVGNDVASRISDEVVPVSSTSGGKIFKWQDDTGQWHFSDTPNLDAMSIEVTLDPKDITVIAAEDTSILNTAPAVSKMSATPEGVSIFNPNSVKKLFKDTEDVKEKLEKRNKEINNLSSL